MPAIRGRPSQPRRVAGCVKLVVDAQLPPSLAATLRQEGHDAVAVREIGLREAKGKGVGKGVGSCSLTLCASRLGPQGRRKHAFVSLYSVVIPHPAHHFRPISPTGTRRGLQV